MDVVTLTSFLTPCLPFLLKKVGAPALDKAAAKVGEDAWEKAKKIWAKLWPKVEAEAAAKVATERLADKPDSAVWKAALEEELAAIFQNEPDLAAVIANILQSTPESSQGNQVRQTAETNQGQMIGQMYGGEVKNIGSIGAIQGDVNL
jgi:hypothetical protein